MTNQITPIILGFMFGILATLFTQVLIRRFGFDNAKRRLILVNINRIRDALIDYENLFKCDYPELIEFVHAHDKLNPKAPYYDSENPQKVYNALMQYFTLRTIVDNKERLVDETLYFLVKNKVVRFNNKRRRASIDDVTLYLPNHNDNSLPGKFSKIKHLTSELFDTFPEKVGRVDFEKLKSTNPQNVSQIINTKLRTKFDHNGKTIEIDNSEWEREINLRDWMDYLPKYRQDAHNLIQAIRVELNDLESIWLPAS